MVLEARDIETRDIATSISTWERELKNTLVQRFGYVKAVGRLKKKHGEEFHVQSQWDIVISGAKKLGMEYGIDEDIVVLIWNQMHEIAKDIEKTIEFDGETLDDKMLYDKEIKPLRNEILTLNESLVQAVCGILNLHGNRKGNKIVSGIMNDASKVEISNKQNIVESELVSYITNNGEEKVSSPRSKTKKTEKFSYNEMKFKDIKHLIPETLVFSNTPTKVVVLNNKIYFLIGTAFGDRGIPSHYVDICGTEMKFLDHNGEWSSCPFIDVLIKCPNV